MQPTYASSTLAGSFIHKMRRRSIPLVDFARGGVGLNDPSLGVDYQDWTSDYVDGKILVGVDGGTLSPILTVAGVVRTALAFDLSMRTHLAYCTGVDSFLYWYDSQAAAMATMTIPGVTDVCLVLDDPRPAYSGNSDIVLTYSRARRIYTRIQRERFQIEHLLRDADMGGAKISRFGMTNLNRLGWSLAAG